MKDMATGTIQLIQSANFLTTLFGNKPFKQYFLQSPNANTTIDTVLSVVPGDTTFSAYVTGDIKNLSANTHCILGWFNAGKDWAWFIDFNFWNVNWGKRTGTSTFTVRNLFT